MEIIDKYGYLENALDYIERNVASGKGLQKIAKKTGVNQDLLSNLSLALKNFSEKQFLTSLKEKIETRHSFISGADVEVSGADISIERGDGRAFVLMNLVCYVVADGEQEDKIRLNIEIFSKNDIKIYAS